ncbi:MAG: hypothetical protein HZB24_04095 [Desulfobacterales bacterium]|nr:hypothetical protein [Desulfobacterales bacterium]
MKTKAVFIIILLLSAGIASADYANRDEIKSDLNALYQAKEKGDNDAIMTVSKRILASNKTAGVTRIPALLCSADVLAKQNRIEAVNDLFDRQIKFVMKSSGNCSVAVFTAMKADFWKDTGHYDLAIDDYQLAIDKCPNTDNAYSKLSLLYSTSSDPKYNDPAKALSLALKAVEIEACSKSLSALAAAYAKAEKFDLALAHIEKAIGAGEKEKLSPSQIDELRAKLSMYKSRQSNGS